MYNKIYNKNNKIIKLIYMRQIILNIDKFNKYLIFKNLLQVLDLNSKWNI